MTIKRLLSSVGISGLMLAAGVQSGFAQQATGEALEEVTVTAQKVTTNLQDTPVAVTAISGAEFAQAPVSDIRTALREVPGIDLVQQNTFSVVVIARGVGPGVLNGQAGISTLYDGVYSSSPIGPRAGYYDISRMEVLLGPQGTLYGRNAEGGVLNVITNDPTFNFGGSGSVGIGNYDLVNLQGAINVPITDSLALRLAGSSNDRDGYLSNGQDDNHTTSFRAKLLYKPSDAFSALLGVEKTSSEGKGVAPVGPFAKAEPSIRNVAYTPNQSYSASGYRTWANINLDVGIGTLTVIPAYIDTDEPRQIISDRWPGIGNPLFETYNLGLGRTLERSGEVRLASKAESPIQWIIGGYGYNSDSESPRSSFQTTGGIGTITIQNGQIVLTGGRAAYEKRTQNSSGYFAQVTVPLTEQLSVVGGARYSEDEATFFNDGNVNAGLAGNLKADWQHTDYRASLQYKVTDDSMLYATYSTGYRPGGFSPAAPYPAYDIEEVASYEIGSKNEFFDRRLRVNASVYYYDYAGYQQTTFVACGGAGQPLCTGSQNTNLVIANADVTVKGAEISTQYQITDVDFLSVNLAYADSEIQDPLRIGNPPNQVNVQGDPVTSSPKLAGNITYARDFRIGPGTLTPELTARYQDKINLTFPNNNAFNNQGAIWRADAQLTYAPDDSNWRINLWGRNLTDEVVKSSRLGANSTYLAEPKVYGVTLSTTF